MNWILILGLAAGVCSTLSALPQAIKTIKTRHTKDLSLWMFILYFCAVTCWLIYGIGIRDVPMILANIVTVTLVGIILALKIRYG